MAEEKYTRCPACRTVFRVTQAQLDLRNGQVRCGHCRTVFDGVVHLISLAPLPRDEAFEANEALGPPTVTLRNARALEPAPAPGEAAPPAAAVVKPAEPEVDYDHRFAWERPRRISRAAIVGFALAVVALTLLFVVQATHHFRDAIAARFPALRPVVAAMCGVIGCEVRPLREIGWLSIEASDLQADPAHQGLLILTATLRNQSRYPVGYPHLELTLSDAKGQVVVRRAIAPPEYLNANADAAGIGGNGEVSVKLFIDASATTQAGYQLYLFYP